MTPLLTTAWGAIALTTMVLLLLALLLKLLSKKFHLPYPPLLVLGGFISSEVLISFGVDTHLRWHNFYDLIYYGLLPILIYEMAFRLKAKHLLDNFIVIMLLAIPLMLIAVLITASLLFYGIDHATSFPFIAALIAAALLSANDPTMVASLFKRLPAPPNFVSLLKGESLFNSIIALVLVSLALSVESIDNTTVHNLSFLEGFFLFVRFFSGGIFIGLGCGLLAWLLMYCMRVTALRMLLSFMVAYGTFFLAEQLNTSGIIAVLSAGLLLNAYVQSIHKNSKAALNKQWQINASIASTILFLLLGVSIYLPVLLNQWIAILIGIAAVLIARAVIIFGGLSFYGYIHTSSQMQLVEQGLLFWGGLKGAVTIALVFVLPSELEYSDTIQAIAYGVVLFSLFIQIPSLRFLIRNKT